jgi:hypothetical protein
MPMPMYHADSLLVQQTDEYYGFLIQSTNFKIDNINIQNMLSDNSQESFVYQLVQI